VIWSIVSNVSSFFLVLFSSHGFHERPLLMFLILGSWARFPRVSAGVTRDHARL
jgi:hypothetical protein